AFDGEFLGRSVVRANQKPRASHEIVEDILLVGKTARQMPAFAAFATAPQVRNGDDAALIEPNAAGEIEVRREADAITAVTSQNRGKLAIQSRSLLAHDVE